jgi:hypothetical protein
MSETATVEQEKIVVTLKGGPGFEAPWIVLHGQSWDEIAAMIKEGEDRGAWGPIQQTGRNFRSASGTAEPPLSGAEVTNPAQTGNWPSGQPSSVPQAVPGTPPCPDCGGPTRFKSGTGSRGPWTGYFCVNKPPGSKGHVIWNN